MSAVDQNREASGPRPLSVLRRFRRRGPVVERCELCGTALASQHQHLFQPESRQLSCCCEACGFLFSEPGLKFRRVPKDIRFLPDFNLTDAQWDSLGIPISLAFFFFSSPVKRVVAFYPSPAGATESLLSLEAWQELERGNPVLSKMEPDVLGLLVNRTGPRRETFLAPIDECFKLVGLIRMHWRGLTGGTEVWKHLEQFFASLRERSMSRKGGGACPI